MLRILSAAALAFALTLSAQAPAAVAVGRPLSIVHADVDGDGLADTVEVYRTGLTQFVLQVTTATTTAAVTVSSTYLVDRFDVSPFIAAAEIDPVAGYDILFATWADKLGVGFNVYTWRGGTLVAQRPPESPVTRGWYVGGDHFFTYQGVRYVDVSNLHTDMPSGSIAVVIRSQWLNGAWVKVGEYRFAATPENSSHYIGLDGIDVIT
ncbi:MAG: hypothetical protein LWW77_10445 [Propionibacteriales bacterium]|nr:hypothetical protein [Propionibacteriales bacterium]